jgi:glycerol dehydrogenase
MTGRIFAAPIRYVQDAGALAQLPALLAGYGARPIILADAAAPEALRLEIEQQLRGSTASVILAFRPAPCTAAEIERLCETARALEADVAVGLGDAGAIFLAKGVSLALGLPLVTIATVPACHAPTSRILEIRDDGAAPGETKQLPRHPDLVLVDSVVLAAAPARHFIAGMGDAIARKIEVEQSAEAGARSLLDGRQTVLAAAAADAAYRTIREHGVAALVQRARHETGEALERVIEAMVLLGGIAHESGGPSIAHALARALASLPACRTVLHGELVAFALLAQLVFEERPASMLGDLVGCYRALGLPARLGEIGIVGDTAPMLALAARRSGDAWLVPVDAKRLADAIARVDTLVAK